MRIAIIGQKGIPVIIGGVEKHVDELSTHLASRGHDVLVYVRSHYTPSELKEYRGVQLIHLPSIKTKHLDAISHTLLACLDVVRRRVDVIHFHSIGPSSLIWLVKILQPFTPVVATFHSQCYQHQKWSWFAKFSLKTAERFCCFFADKVITVSEDLAHYAAIKYEIKPVYIPNGVRMPESRPARIITERWGLKPGSYFLTTSRLIRHKGIHYAIKAFDKIATDKKLVIVGEGYFTDNYVAELERLADGNKNIIFTGVQSGATLEELYSNAYLLIQPSESEGLSISILDAMSYSTAVLVSDIPENLVAVAEIGFTFKNREVDDLARQLAFLDGNPGLVRERGRLSRDHVAQHYNWSNLVGDVTAVYEDAKSLYERDIYQNAFKRLVNWAIYRNKA